MADSSHLLLLVTGRSWVIVSACGLYYCGTLIVLVSTGFWIVQISEEIGGAATGLW